MSKSGDDKDKQGVSRRLVLAGALAAGAGSTVARASAQVGDLAPDAPGIAPETLRATRIAVPGRNGVVAAGHPLASGAGLRMLLAGGHAGDAAVAAMAVLNVVEPWASSAAGNGFATVYDPSAGKPVSLHFAGAAPRALDPDEVSPDDLARGPKAAVTPGAFGGWIELLKKQGRLSLKDVLAPAISYARDGHAIDPSIVGFIGMVQGTISKYPTTRDIFLPGGKPPTDHQLFKNEPLARTFETLVKAEQDALRGGASRERALSAAYDEFYSGSIGREIAGFHRKAGGYLRLSDLKSYRPTWQDAASTSYRGYNVYSTPPTSRGGLEVCLQLNLLEAFEVSSLAFGSAGLVHLEAEAIKAAKSEIYPYVADPAFSGTPVSALLSKEFAAARAARISSGRASAFGAPTDLRPFDPKAPPPPELPKPKSGDDGREGDTTSLSIVDSRGVVVVVTPTLGGGFGTNVVAGSTGLLLNNGLRIGSTSPYPGTANYVGPGKTPILNNSPTIVMKDGQFYCGLGSPGGETIGQTEFQVLVNLLDYEMNFQEAVEAPRFSVQPRPNFYLPGAQMKLQIEKRYPPTVLEALQSMGHTVEPVGTYAIGSMQGVQAIGDAGWLGAADPRRMAAAAAF